MGRGPVLSLNGQIVAWGYAGGQSVSRDELSKVDALIATDRGKDPHSALVVTSPRDGERMRSLRIHAEGEAPPHRIVHIIVECDWGGPQCMGDQRVTSTDAGSWSSKVFDCSADAMARQADRFWVVVDLLDVDGNSEATRRIELSAKDADG